MNTSLQRISKTLAQRAGFSQSRNMSSSGPAPTGWEAKVREKLPEDHQIVLAVLGAYAGLFTLVKIWPSSKKEAPEAAASSSGNSTTIPSLMEDSFEEWAKIPGNLAKWESSLAELGN